MQVHDKELKVVMIQNEVAKLTVDVLNTEAHNLQLGDTLKLLDDELADKAKVIDKYQFEIQRRNDDIEKKTRNVDTLNRKLEKLLYDMEGEDTGVAILHYCLLSLMQSPSGFLAASCCRTVLYVDRPRQARSLSFIVKYSMKILRIYDLLHLKSVDRTPAIVCLHSSTDL